MYRILEKVVEDKKNAWLWCPRSFLPKLYTGKFFILIVLKQKQNINLFFSMKMASSKFSIFEKILLLKQ